MDETADEGNGTDVETRTLELELPESDYRRLKELETGDPAVRSRLEAAVRTELDILEHVAGIETRRQDPNREFPGMPDPGPLDSPIGALLGFEVEALGDGTARLSMDATRRHANRGGPVQGGVITSLADTTTALAFMTTLDPGESTTNIELKINFLRPVFDDTIEAEAMVVRRGRRTGLVECDVRNTDGELVARLSTTYMVLDGE